MGGKGAIFLVLGFSTIFLVFGHRFNSLSTETLDNITNYYAHTQAYNISVTAANIAASKLYFDSNWEPGSTYRNVYFNGGEYSVTKYTATVGDTVLQIVTPETVYNISNPGRDRLQAIYVRAKYHINGKYPFGGSPENEIIDNETVIVLAPSSFAYYGNYYQTMSAFPATGDVFSGPFHVNGRLITYGSPTFTGRVTSKDGLTTRQTSGGTELPDFQDGYEGGVDVPPDFDTTGMRLGALTNGKIFKDTTGAGRRTRVNFEFLPNGNVKYRQKIGSGSWSSYTTEPLANLAPNGTIFVERGIVKVKGTLNGKVTVVSSSKGDNNAGKIIQTDDLRYAYRKDPIHYGNAPGILGLVAEKDITLQYNHNTKHQDIYTDAVMYAQKGKVGPDNGLMNNDGRLRDWKIFGSIAAKDVKATAYYSRQWIDGRYIFAPYKGYRFVQDYDNRVNLSPPPFYPTSDKFHVATWLEKRIYKPGQI